jgi:hypothetical protein
VPPFLLSIYQAAGIQYGVRVGGSSRRSTRSRQNYGRNLGRVLAPARSAGCSSCRPPGSRLRRRRQQGRRRKKIPYNPVDAIFAAARYLKAAGLRATICARDLRLQPRRLVRQLGAACAPASSPACRPTSSASLSGLTEGRFPVFGTREVRGRHLRAGGRDAPRRTGPERRAAGRVAPRPSRDQHLREARARGSSRSGRQDRQGSATAAGSGNFIVLQRRLRQPLPVRAPRFDLALLPGAEGRSRGHAAGRQGGERALAPRPASHRSRVGRDATDARQPRSAAER